MIDAMSQTEARELLSRRRTGRLGCIAGEYPYVIPINYIFADPFLLSHSLPGLKINAMRARPRVCLQVDEIDDPFHWKSVLAFGLYEEITNEAERERAMNHLLSAFPQLTAVESLIAEDAGSPRPIAFRIRIRHLTGLLEK